MLILIGNYYPKRKHINNLKKMREDQEECLKEIQNCNTVMSIQKQPHHIKDKCAFHLPKT